MGGVRGLIQRGSAARWLGLDDMPHPGTYLKTEYAPGQSAELTK